MPIKPLRNSLAYLKGVSGCGKGTRVSQLLVFLIEELSLEYELLKRKSTKDLVIHRKPPKSKPDWKPNMDKEFAMGLHFPAMNILFVGRMAKSRGPHNLVSWNSLDYFFSQTNMRSTHLMDLYATKMNVIMEGMASATISGNAPWDAYEKHGLKNLFFQYYIYDNYIQVLARVIGRNGEPIKGTPWPHNKYFEREWTKAAAWRNAFTAKAVRDGLWMPRESVKSEVTTFGEKYLRFLGYTNLVPEFLAWSKDHNTLRRFESSVQCQTLVDLYDFFKTEMKSSQEDNDSGDDDSEAGD